MMVCSWKSKEDSIFPVGVKVVKGTFRRHEVIRITDLRGDLVGFGVSNFASSELSPICEMRSSQITANTQIGPNRVMDKDWMVAGPRLQRIISGA
jgi:glutamate 5-kinase